MKEEILKLISQWEETAQLRGENDGSGGPVEQAEALAESDALYSCAGELRQIIDKN